MTKKTVLVTGSTEDPSTFIPGFVAPLALALHVLAFRAFITSRGAAARSA